MLTIHLWSTDNIAVFVALAVCFVVVDNVVYNVVFVVDDIDYNDNIVYVVVVVVLFF